MNRSNLFFCVLAVLWMLVIFIFSSKPVEESNANSDAVEKVLGHATVSDFSEKNEKEVQNFLDKWRVIVRKAAHVCEYALLCFLIFFGLPSGWNQKKKFLLAVCGAVVYAISDEIHQLFVPGRAALVSDVFIDLGGAVLGGVFAYVIICWIRHIKCKKSNRMIYK